MLYSPQAHKGAVIHSGWRGTSLGITPKTLQQFCELVDIEPQDCITAIGPAISMQNYQVSLEVAEALSNAVRLTKAELIKIGWMSQDDSEHYRVDLKSLNMLQLIQQGVKQVELSPYCTWENNDMFFSRRKGDPQNQIAFLMLL